MSWIGFSTVITALRAVADFIFYLSSSAGDEVPTRLDLLGGAEQLRGANVDIKEARGLASGGGFLTADRI